MIDQSLVKNFIWESATETFETMIFLPIEKTDDEDIQISEEESLICTITFTGSLQGSFSAQCSAKTAEKIAKAMLMLEADEPIKEQDTYDAIGEVVNMLLGGLKTRLNGTDIDLKISIPTVISGQTIRPALGRDTTKMAVITSIEGQPMKLTLGYKNVK